MLKARVEALEHAIAQALALLSHEDITNTNVMSAVATLREAQP